MQPDSRQNKCPSVTEFTFAAKTAYVRSAGSSTSVLAWRFALAAQSSCLTLENRSQTAVAPI